MCCGCSICNTPASCIDSGCGYAWTTEWLFRSGYDAIGVDICRTYLEIGVSRIGAFRPHLVVGDVENLPFADGIAERCSPTRASITFPIVGGRLAGYDRVLNDGRHGDPGRAGRRARGRGGLGRRHGEVRHPRARHGVGRRRRLRRRARRSARPSRCAAAGVAAELGRAARPGVRRAATRPFGGNLFRLDKGKPARRLRLRAVVAPPPILTERSGGSDRRCGQLLRPDAWCILLHFVVQVAAAPAVIAWATAVRLVAVLQAAATTLRAAAAAPTVRARPVFSSFRESHHHHCALVGSFALSAALTPLLRRLAHRAGVCSPSPHSDRWRPRTGAGARRLRHRRRLRRWRPR